MVSSLAKDVTEYLGKNIKYASPNLNAYIKCFGFDYLVRRLSKKVYKHLETLDKRYIFL